MATKYETTLISEKELPDDEKNPNWGGTIVQITQYGESRPKVTIKRYYLDKSTQEKKRSGFVDIPPAAVQTVADFILKAAGWIEKRYPDPKSTKSEASPF